MIKYLVAIHICYQRQDRDKVVWSSCNSDVKQFISYIQVYALVVIDIFFFCKYPSSNRSYVSTVRNLVPYTG